MTNIHTSSLIVPSPHVLLHVRILTSVCNYILFGLLVLHPNKCNLAKIQNEYGSFIIQTSLPFILMPHLFSFAVWYWCRVCYIFKKKLLLRPLYVA